MAVERKLITEHKRRVMVREFLHKETERAGFGGADIQRTPMGTRINLVAERPGFVIGRRGSTIKKLTSDLAARFELDNPQIEVQESDNPSINPHIMAMKLAEALERGWHFRRAGHSTLRRIMDGGARGAIIRLSGKVTGGRSRVEKFQAGHIKYCGDTALQFMSTGYALAKKKLGTIGVTVSIMDPNARLPDEITIQDPTVAKPERGHVAAAPTPGMKEGGATAAAEAAPEAGDERAAPPGEAATAGTPSATAAPAASAEGAPAAREGGLEGAVTDIAGVGKAKADALAEAGYGDLTALENASEEDLAGVAGVGPKLAQKIKDELRKMRD